MTEEWRDIPGFEGHYQVSNHGEVRSLERIVKAPAGRTRPIEAKVLRPMSNLSGYVFVFLRRDGERQKFYVHRLVAIAFIENPEGKEIVNHKDCNRSNNILLNLEWATGSENVLHGIAMKKERIAISVAVEEPTINPEDLPW